MAHLRVLQADGAIFVAGCRKMPIMINLALVLSLLASQASLPKPAGDPATWVTINDYPREALDQRQEGPVGFSLDVDGKGNVTSCRISQTSGAPSLDAATCALIFVRAHFDPALNAEGRPAAGTFASRIRWVYPTKIEDSRKDLAMAPAELRGSPRDGTGSTILHVDTNGIITECEKAEKPYNNVLAPPDLCGIFTVGSRYGAPGLSKGKPVKRKLTLTLSVWDVNVR